MDVYEAIEKRRSVRVFKRGVSDEQLRKLILAGTKAILNNPSVIEQVYQQTLEKPLPTRGAERQRDAYRNCTVVAVCNKKGHGIGRKPWMNIENIASTWMCIENIALAATADELDTVTSILREEHKAAVEKLLGIPEDYELATMLLIGVKGEVPGERLGKVRPAFSWLHKNRFGTTTTP
jgi:nitroreductase